MPLHDCRFSLLQRNRLTQSVLREQKSETYDKDTLPKLAANEEIMHELNVL